MILIGGVLAVLIGGLAALALALMGYGLAVAIAAYSLAGSLSLLGWLVLATRRRDVVVVTIRP